MTARVLLNAHTTAGWAAGNKYKPGPRNKYNAHRTIVDGIPHDSKREARLYQELKLRQKIGEITELTPHPSWEIEVNGILITTYTADMSFKDKSNKLHVVDVKSEATVKLDTFRLRRKLMKAVHNIEVEVIF